MSDNMIPVPIIIPSSTRPPERPFKDIARDAAVEKYKSQDEQDAFVSGAVWAKKEELCTFKCVVIGCVVLAQIVSVIIGIVCGMNDSWDSYRRSHQNIPWVGSSPIEYMFPFYYPSKHLGSWLVTPFEKEK